MLNLLLEVLLVTCPGLITNCPLSKAMFLRDEQCSPDATLWCSPFNTSPLKDHRVQDRTTRLCMQQPTGQRLDEV